MCSGWTRTWRQEVDEWLGLGDGIAGVSQGAVVSHGCGVFLLRDENIKIDHGDDV